jgi:HlyD family secretion protein
MTGKKVPLLAAVLVVVLGGLGAVLWFYDSNGTADEGVLRLYGNVDLREVALAINGNERIARMLVEEGQRVTKGQVLASLKSDRQAAEVASAEARVAAQQAVVDKLLAGSRPEEIRKARADVAAAVADLNTARLTYERAKRLYEDKLGSEQARDDARGAAEAAEARLEAAREALALMVEGPRQEDIASAQATLAADKAQLALVRQVLDDTVLYAPADGIIRDRILEPGDIASPQTPVYTLALTDPLWVRAYVQESDLGRVRPGMRAQVLTDSFPDKRYEGWVGYIAPTAEFTPKTVQTEELRTHLVYQVRINVCNPHGELRLGMPATVEILLDQPPAVAGAGAEIRCGEGNE